MALVGLSRVAGGAPPADAAAGTARGLYSSRWYRVAALRPSLVAHLRIRRQRWRGEDWFVYLATDAARQLRLNRAAHALVGRFDGRATLDAVWTRQLGDPDAALPTQDELIDVLVQLHDAGLVMLLQDELPAAVRASAVDDARATTPTGKGNGHPLAWRVTLGDPSPLLDRLEPLRRVAFSVGGGAVWGIAMALLVMLVVLHAPELAVHAQQLFASPSHGWVAVALYVPMKAAHELAHAFAVRHGGGEVRRAGLTFVCGLPLPWVDASAATAFARRRERLLVGAAGMMAELLLAALALVAWRLLPDGGARDVAFAVVLIGAVSTIAFNANPLQRLDGYALLTDAFDLPNLATRSRAWWSDTLGRRLLRLPSGEPFAAAPGERRWLAAYAPAAWSYGVLLVGATALWLAQTSWVLAVAVAALLGWHTVLRPALAFVRPLLHRARLQPATARRARGLALAAAAAAFVFGALPLPDGTLVQGVVWPADRVQLRAAEPGFVAEVLRRDGDRVAAGDPVLRLASPALEAEWQRQEARVAALEAAWVQAQPGGGETSAGDRLAALTAARAVRERLQERRDALLLRAAAAGRLALPHTNDLPGRWIDEGRLVGQVIDGAAPTVRVALPEDEAAVLRRAPGVSVRLASSEHTAHPAGLLRDGGGAVRRLPSAALSQRHGGPVATDPQDAEDLEPLRPVVLLDVQFDRADAASRVGERAWVRFEYGWTPLAWRLAAALHRTLQQRRADAV